MQLVEDLRALLQTFCRMNVLPYRKAGSVIIYHKHIMDHVLKNTLIIVGVIIVIGGGWYGARMLSADKEHGKTVQEAVQKTVATATHTSADDAVDWASLPTTNVTLTDDGLTISDAGTYVVSGSSTGQVVVNSEGSVRIVLNGATITSAHGPAIHVQNAATTVMQLADGTTNTVRDTVADATNTGVISVAGDMVIEGEGTLTMTAAADGVVAKNLTIASGTLNVTSTGKAFTVAETLTVDGGEITVPNSEEGLEAARVVINGGTIDLYATDDGINASSDTLTDVYINITGGDIKVRVAAGDTDALDSNGNISMSDGTLTITAPMSSFDFDGTAEFTGGDITVNGNKVTTIENSMPTPPRGVPRRY